MAKQTSGHSTMPRDDGAEHRRISKFMSRVLRHQPQSIGLRLDAQGWTGIDALIERAGAHGMPLTHELILAVVAASDKKRFALDGAGKRIRANQGHSIDIDLALAPCEPPPILFHGTAEANLAAIRAEGLKPGRRQHVHLSLEVDTATNIGRRHGRPVALEVAAGRMWSAGFAFFRAENGVWLTAAVPPEFIAFP
jgi:putative RNA 2'-phosphotransferase